MVMAVTDGFEVEAEAPTALETKTAATATTTTARSMAVRGARTAAYAISLANCQLDLWALPSSPSDPEAFWERSRPPPLGRPRRTL